MPYAILSLMIANLAFLRMDQIGLARAAVVFAIPLFAVRCAREGLLGEGLRDVVLYAPAWKILAIGVAVIAVEVLLDSVGVAEDVSTIVQSVMGPIGFGMIIVSAEIAMHRRLRS